MSALQPKTTYLKDYQSPHFSIDKIDLHFDLYEAETIVRATMKITRHSNRQIAENLVLDGDELTLQSIKLNGKTLLPNEYEANPQSLTVYHVPDAFELEIVTILHPEKNTALSGLYRSNHTYCTQCEAEGFRRITYYLDHPDVLSRFTTTITAEAARYPTLLSNGNLIAVGQLNNGRHFATWEDPFKKPSYLFALVAGDFDLLEDTFITQSKREINLRIYVEKGYLDQAHHAMYAVKEAMRWDEITFGREYDLDIYMIVAIGDFNMGAMENKGLNIFNTKYVLAKPQTATDDDFIHIVSVVGHEYFHNWSGNRVTCRDWFQLSLKEGLTIFRDQSFTEDLFSRAVMRIRDVHQLREVQFPEDAGPLAHPVRPESYIEINNFYTATIYNKGAEVLRMMQTILGKAQFRKGMDLYFTRYDGQAVTIEDFVRTMEEVSGIDLAQFRLWYSQAGTPLLQVSAQYDATHKKYTLTITQTTEPTPGQPHKKPLWIPIRMGLLNQSGDTISLHLANEPEAAEKILHLKEAKQTFEFSNVPSHPIPSLLRNFSAPVKLQYAYSDAELQFLLKHDNDLFNRYEAGQNYLLRVLLQLIHDYQQGKSLHVPAALIENFRYLLTHPAEDKLLLSEMLMLPSENYIGEQMPIVDVDAIHAAREFILQTLATELQALFNEHYQTNQSSVYQFNMEEVGKRALKNRALAYLMRLPAHINLGVKQFQAALRNNMTDTLAALTALANSDVSHRDQALSEFYLTWKEDALVVDKWLSIQAMSKLKDTLTVVKQLKQHAAFDIKNPNKVYALIGAFSRRNPSHFHIKSGEGYVFLSETVLELDQLNPQIAARMVNPLTTWRRYDKERQKLMQAQLTHLLSHKKISSDLYELVAKSLE